MRVDRGAVREPDAARRPLDVQADHVPGGQHLGAELGGLAPGPVGELRPGHPVGEAQVVLDPRALAGLPAGGGPLDQHRAQALGRAVQRGAQAGRAAADHDQVVEVLGRRGGQADVPGQFGVGRLDQRLAVRGDHHRQPVQVGPGRREQPLALRLVGGVPAVRHLVAGQELADRRRPRGPPVPHHPGLRHRPVIGLQPGLQQRVDHRVQLLLRRVPRLEQVVVEVDDVDRVDRGAGVRVGGEQDPPGPGVDVHGLLEELDAVHLGHPVVGQDHRDQLAAQLDLAQRVQRRGAGLGPHDPVLFAVPPAQVTGYRPGNPGVVVNGQDGGPPAARRGHRASGGGQGVRSSRCIPPC